MVTVIGDKTVKGWVGVKCKHIVHIEYITPNMYVRTHTHSCVTVHVSNFL